MPHAKQIWFWFQPQWFCYRFFLCESGCFIFRSDCWLGSWLVVSICHHSWWIRQPGSQGHPGSWPREVWGRGASGWHLPGNIEIEDLWWGPGSLASGCRAIVLVLDLQLSLAPPPGVSSFSFCVTYVMPLRMILETSRPAVIDLPLLCSSPVPLLSLHLLCQDIFFPSFKSFRSKYPCIWFPLFFF